MEMDNIFTQIEKIKREMEALQEELKNTTVRGEDENNLVTAIVSGLREVIDYELDYRRIRKMDPNELKQAVVQATNNGLQKARELDAKRRKEIIGDINLPNIPGLLD